MIGIILNETLGIILISMILVCMVYVVFVSSVMISERKARYRAGTHDYYDNPIDDDSKIPGKE